MAQRLHSVANGGNAAPFPPGEKTGVCGGLFPRFARCGSNNLFKQTLMVPLAILESTSERQGRRLNDFTQQKDQEA